MKKALAILGDAWHAPHTIRRVMAETLEAAGYDATILTDYTTPSSYDVDFSALKQTYDCIVISRYALNDYKSFQDAEKKQRVYWLTHEQQGLLEDFVLSGGSLLLHHDGLGFYPKDSILCKLARCFCINHPAIVPIRMEPMGFTDSLNRDIAAYDIADEEFNVEMDAHATNVFLESVSAQNGRHPQGWCHTYGKGKVAVFIPGHDSTVQRHPMVQKGIENALVWLSDTKIERESGETMRAIMVMFDSLRRTYLPPYGAQNVYAPNFARLAQHTVTFDNCYVGSMPCMPARRELHTGRLNFLHRSWGPVEPFDDSMPELLKRSGIHSHLVSDHLHYWEDGGATYHQRYSTWEIIRGQEADHWIPQVSPELPPEHHGRYFVRDFVNRHVIDCEEKQPQTKTFDAGLRFLEMNEAKDDWFLQIETFDPHEPYYTMQHYKDLYPHTYSGKHFDWPDYVPVCEGDEAKEHLLCEYKALLSMCDKNLGRVLDFMDDHDMWKDTMLIVNTDHGFMLSEHDWWGKCVMPFYDEVAHIPLFLHDPRCGVQNERRAQLVQTIDLCPTLLSFFARAIPQNVQGKDLAAVMQDNRAIHSAALFGQHGAQVNVTDGRYVYMRACATPDNGPLYEYTLMPTHSGALFSTDELQTARLHPGFSFTKGCPVLQIDSTGKGKKARTAYATFSPAEIKQQGGPYAEVYTTRLYDLATDPNQMTPLHNPAVEARMCQLMIEIMMENDAPAEQYERLGLAGLVNRVGENK